MVWDNIIILIVANVLEAKIQYLREHYYKIRQCFKNDGGKGYVLLDTRVDVNEWYKEIHGEVFL